MDPDSIVEIALTDSDRYDTSSPRRASTILRHPFVASGDAFRPEVPARARDTRYPFVVRGRMRIVDPECLHVLRALRDAFTDEHIDYAIAGGMGVQALVAAAGLDHLLRSTGDIDVIVDADDASIVRALNHLAALLSELTVVQNPAAKNAWVGALNIDWIDVREEPP